MKECSKCLFTENDYPAIILNEHGICDICLVNEKRLKNLESQQTPEALNELITKIKKSKTGKYDCLIGISGGTDSSYLVYLAKKWGLNPLLLHVDSGWNSEISVINIEKIVDKSGFDLWTEVLPWKEMKDVQRAFILAGVLDIDLPFDNAMLMYNYNTAKKFGIQYILNGYSTSTEGIMPPNFSHYKYDKRNIIDIHKSFGRTKRKKLQFLSTLNYLYFDKIKKIQFLHPLNHLEYNKAEAKKTITDSFEWQDYGGKHYESVFTRFYQGHILPEKFSIDKRKSHLSMLICANQLTKAEAISELNSHAAYPSELLKREDQRFFLKKLSLTENFWMDYLKSPGVSHREFKSDLDIYDLFRPLYRLFRKVFRFSIFKV
jgi:N-acetyl sugar amidotransferase